MVREHCDWMGGTLQVMPPYFKVLDDCKQLLVIDFIIDFRQQKLLGMESDRMQQPICCLLGKHSPQCIIGGVCFNCKGQWWVHMDENRHRGKGMLQHIKGILGLWHPLKVMFWDFVGKSSQWDHDMRKPCNELTIKIGKPKENLHIPKTCWRLPIQNSLNLCRVHGDPLASDNIAQELHMILIKATLFEVSI